MALLATLLFVLLSPGVLLTLPPVGKTVLASGKMSLVAVLVHALVFGVALYLLKQSSYAASFEGFQAMPPLPTWLQSQANNLKAYTRPDNAPIPKSGFSIENVAPKYRLNSQSDFSILSNPLGFFAAVNEALAQNITKAEFTGRMNNLKTMGTNGLNIFNTMRNDVKSDLDALYNYTKDRRDSLNRIIDYLVTNYDKLKREPGPFGQAPGGSQMMTATLSAEQRPIGTLTNSLEQRPIGTLTNSLEQRPMGTLTNSLEQRPMGTLTNSATRV